MAADTTILSGDVSVWYLSNNRTKMMDWSGAAGDTITMNQLYSAMATLLDESATIDDGSAFNADTPVEYTTGKIDAGDNDPWYVTMNLMEHVTGGSLRSSGWTHVNGSNAGIVIVAGTNVDIVAGDVGINIAGGSDGNGTLLEVIEGSQGDFLVIRPDTSATGDEFSATQTLTCNSHTFTQGGEDQNTGEMIWANAYSIGTIDKNVHLYVYQGEFNDPETLTTPATDISKRVFSVNSSTVDYWTNGHIDMCVPIMRWWRAASDGAWDVVDDGYLRVFAHKGGDLFASFEVANSTTSGGRNPVPLQSSIDLNQGHGTKKIATGAWSGTFTDLEIISQASSDARGIIDLGNSTDGVEIVYWPIAKAVRGGEVASFITTQVITGAVSTETATSSGAEADDGPADAAWFTNTTPDLLLGDSNVKAAGNNDIDNDGNDENYAILIDCNANPLSEVYQWLKYICQYGQGDTDMVEQAFSDDLSQDAVYGEEYEGGMGYAVYTAETGTVKEGDRMTQAGADPWEGVILMHDETNNIAFFRNCRGTLEIGTNILQDVTPGSNHLDTITTVSNFAFSATSPFGTFAGGTFFGARGVLIDDYLAADENRFILTDIEGDTRERPTSIVIEVTNLWGNAITNGDADLVGVYPLTGSGGDIDKDPTDAIFAMDCIGGEAKGDADLAVDDIPVWAPSSGRVVLIDDDNKNTEYVLRYTSYDSTTDVYTLANVAAFTTTGTNSDTRVEYSGGAFLTTVKRGDLVYNVTEDLVGYVKSVDSNTVLTLIGAGIAGNTTGDSVEINAIPITVTSSDNAFNCIMHEYPLTNEEQISIIYPGSQFYFRVKVRNTREDDLSNGPIKPYSSDGSTTGTNQSIPTVRTIDTVIS